MSRPPTLTVALAVACTLISLDALVPPATRGAEGLVVTSATRYEVRPDERLVTVTIDAVATNVTPDTPTARAYYTGITMSFQADASNIAASSGGRPISVAVVESTDEYVAAEIEFGAQFFYRQSYRFQITFQLRDAGGALNRDTRVGQSFAAFSVWAFGSPEATDASIEVAWPPGYDVDAFGSDLRRLPTADGPRLVATAISDPTTFGAYVSGEKAGARTRHPIEIPMSTSTAPVLLLAWPDDPEWVAR